MSQDLAYRPNSEHCSASLDVSQPASSWADLPDVLLRVIFFNLPGLDRLAANQVCRSWRHAMPFTDMRITLIYRKHFLCIQTLIKFIQSLHAICHRQNEAELSLNGLSLELSNPNDPGELCPTVTISGAYLLALKALTGESLLSLNLECVALEPNAKIGLLLNFRHLRTLKFTDESVWNVSLAQHFPVLETLSCNLQGLTGALPSTLREIRVIFPPRYFGGETVEWKITLDSLLIECPLLETLHLENMLLSRGEGFPVAPLPLMMQLKHLLLKYVECELRENNFSVAPNLETLVLKARSLDRAMFDLTRSDIAFQLPRLKKLSLSFEDDSFQTLECVNLLQRFAASSDLRVLNLRQKSFRNINKVDLATLIAQQFPMLRHLTWKVVASNQLPDVIDSSALLALWGYGCQDRLLESVAFIHFLFSADASLALALAPVRLHSVRFWAFSQVDQVDSLLYGVQQVYQMRHRTNVLRIIFGGASEYHNHSELKDLGFVLEELV